MLHLLQCLTKQSYALLNPPISVDQAEATLAHDGNVGCQVISIQVLIPVAKDNVCVFRIVVLAGTNLLSMSRVC